MTNLVTLGTPRRRSKIGGLCIALSLAVGIFAESAAALAVKVPSGVWLELKVA